jgi:ATP-dependent Clp protease ATP-binding subunit ClpA
MNEALVVGAIAGVIAGAIAGLVVLLSSQQRPGRRTTSGFDHFNDRAKRVLALAQDEAIRFNHNYIGTEHLLLGLVREGEGVAARVLDSFGVELSKVRTAVQFIIGRGDSTTSPSEITLSPRMKKVIELAIDEARKLGHRHIGTEHLLLGLVGEGGGIANGVLVKLGVPLEKVRHQVIATLGQPHDATPPPTPSRPVGPFDRFTDTSRRVLALAGDEAVRMRHQHLGTEHVLIGLLQMQTDGTTAQRALGALGVTLERARTGVSSAVPPGDRAGTMPNDITWDPGVQRLIDKARETAGNGPVAPEHLLLALVADTGNVGAQVLAGLGATGDRVRETIDRSNDPPKN